MPNNKAFLGINLDLIENPKYQNLDIRAVMLYSLYADRSRVSFYYARKGNTAFMDNSGVFIRFSNEFAAKIIRVSEKTVGKLRQQLLDCGLINIIRDGLKGYKIYVQEAQRTPKDVALLMPWKNYTIETSKSVSDWSLSSKLEFATTLDMIVKVNSSTTNRKNLPTSVSQFSNKHVINNNIDLNDNARENELNSKTFSTLPQSIKTTYNSIFGFIAPNTAKSLHDLLENNQEEMVCCAIKQGEGRKVTSPIKFIQAVLANAIKQGAKTAKDMIEIITNYRQQLAKKTKSHQKHQFSTKKESQIDENRILSELQKQNPAKYQQIKSERQQKSQPFHIPIFKISDEFSNNFAI